VNGDDAYKVLMLSLGLALFVFALVLLKHGMKI
jgi:hypothetical protein